MVKTKDIVLVGLLVFGALIIGQTVSGALGTGGPLSFLSSVFPGFFGGGPGGPPSGPGGPGPPPPWWAGAIGGIPDWLKNLGIGIAAVGGTAAGLYYGRPVFSAAGKYLATRVPSGSAPDKPADYAQVPRPGTPVPGTVDTYPTPTSTTPPNTGITTGPTAGAQPGGWTLPGWVLPVVGIGAIAAGAGLSLTGVGAPIGVPVILGGIALVAVPPLYSVYVSGGRSDVLGVNRL